MNEAVPPSPWIRFQQPLTVGELAERTGVATSALRFYEDRGLIAAERTESGHRRYPRGTIRRVAFIVFAQRMGLSLEEIRVELARLPDGETSDGRGLGAALGELGGAAVDGDRRARAPQARADRLHRLRLPVAGALPHPQSRRSCCGVGDRAALLDGGSPGRRRGRGHSIASSRISSTGVTQRSAAFESPPAPSGVILPTAPSRGTATACLWRTYFAHSFTPPCLAQAPRRDVPSNAVPSVQVARTIVAAHSFTPPCPVHAPFRELPAYFDPSLQVALTVAATFAAVSPTVARFALRGRLARQQSPSLSPSWREERSWAASPARGRARGRQAVVPGRAARAGEWATSEAPLEWRCERRAP